MIFSLFPIFSALKSCLKFSPFCQPYTWLRRYPSRSSRVEARNSASLDKKKYSDRHASKAVMSVEICRRAAITGD